MTAPVATTTTYDERLAPPLWVWLAVLSVAGVSAAALHGGAAGWRSVVPYVVLLPLAVGWLLAASRGRVTVADGVLHVPGARIPLDHLGGVTPPLRLGGRVLVGGQRLLGRARVRHRRRLSCADGRSPV